MIILGIETSCDETAAAVLKQDKNGIYILSNIVASSSKLQSKYGGIIPEQAAREQIKSIIPVIEEALHISHITYHDLDAIAVTYGPGLIGSLLVGVETAKTLATIWNEQSSRASRTKPLIPVNHLLGHFYANWITGNWSTSKLVNQQPSFPCIGLLVSGGHTDLVLFTDHNKYTYLGGTRDDAAGECFDKCARLLGLPYPGGPEISKLATKGDAFKYKLPRPMINSKNFDFSFSGLKTAVTNLLHTSEVKKSDYTSEVNNLCASIEAAIIDVLVEKTVRAAQKYKVEQIMIAGGVAANKKLVSRLQVSADSLREASSLKIVLHVPQPHLCTDNGAMIAAAGFFSKPVTNPLKVVADPNLALSS